MIGKERYVLISVFVIVLFASLFLLIVTWKNRYNIPKTLTILTIVIYIAFMFLSLFSLIFIVSFGYNS